MPTPTRYLAQAGTTSTARRSIPTTDSLRSQRNRADRRRAVAARVKADMHHGAVLHMHYGKGRTLWFLSTGVAVPQDVAQIVIASPDVVGCSDGLFKNTPGQSWRHV